MNKLYTIGHSTRSIDDFISLLRMYKINQLVDIRTIPKSRHNPQYEQEQLKTSMENVHIQYIYLKNLGGLRSSTKPSLNGAWRNRSFRNYADYMQTDEFKLGLAELVEVSQNSNTAIMCAEAVPWRCHRSLVGDALLVHKIAVIDIFDLHNSKPHTLTSFAVVNGTEITYPSTKLQETSKK